LRERCFRQVFETWLEICLIPVLKPGQKLVRDNATFHKGGRIDQLVQAAGCEVWYLPAYSPDLNKIERGKVLAKKSYPQATGVLPYLADGDGACPELSVLTNLAVAILSKRSQKITKV
jgi:hypothetical protein